MAASAFRGLYKDEESRRFGVRPSPAKASLAINKYEHDVRSWLRFELRFGLAQARGSKRLCIVQRALREVTIS